MSLKTLLTTCVSRGLVPLQRNRAHRHRVASAAAVVPGQGSTTTTTTIRGYYNAAKPGRSAAGRVVDLRSDTVTRPGAEMRKAMSEADVGDDVMGEDPTVNELQRIAADMFGMEAALFVPSGTMSNLIAVMVHCRERGDEVIVGDLSHLHIYEQGGTAQAAQHSVSPASPETEVTAAPVKDDRDQRGGGL